MNDPLLRVENLYKHYPVYQGSILLRRQVGIVHAVDGVNLRIDRGENLGLVGESGCGKTTLGKAIMYLEETTSGRIHFDGMDVIETFRNRHKENIRRFRRGIQMVFQNPYLSLDPRMTVYDILSEPFIILRNVPEDQWKGKIYDLLEMVNLEDYHAERYPHEFSGGQRQRICIARALAVDPKLIVADEPVSSLDVSIRAQILNLLIELQKKRGLSYLYISHDLGSVRQITNRVLVMYVGKVAELANTDELFNTPLHPYTQALLSAIPIPDPDSNRRRIILQGEVPSAVNPPSGCRFHPRCPYVMDVCRTNEPSLEEVEPDHRVACWLRTK